MENKSSNKDKIEIKKNEEKSYLRRWKDFHLYYEDYIDTENYNYEDNNFENLSKIDNIESILSYIGQLIIDNFNDYLEGKSNFSKIGLDNCAYILYENAGNVLFLYGLYYELKDERYKYIAEKALEQFETDILSVYKEAEEGNLIQYITCIYIYFNLYRMFNQNKFYKKYEEYLNYIEDYINLHEDLKYKDLFKKYKDHIYKENKLYVQYATTYAIIIIVFLNIYEDRKDEILLSSIEKLSRYLYDLVICFKGKHSYNNHKLECGYIGGYSLFAQALLASGRVLCNDDYYYEALALVKKEDEFYDSSLKDWAKKDKQKDYHLNHAPGILISRNKMLNYIKKEDTDIVRGNIAAALNNFYKIEFKEYFDISVLNGLAGSIDIFSTLAYELKNSFFIEKINKIIKMYIRYLNKYPEDYQKFFTIIDMDFLTGVLGVGYSILRFNNLNFPSIFSFDLFKLN